MHAIFFLLTITFVCLNGNVIPDESIPSEPAARNINACNKWYAAEPDPAPFLAKTRKCPCRVPNTFPQNYNDGAVTWKTDLGCAASSQPNTCSYHKGAHGCYRFAYESKGPGAQCCYTKAGEWISDPFAGAGTLDRERAPDSIFNIAQALAHNSHDVVPWNNCCKDSDTTRASCLLYYAKRPAGECVYY
jgi:hypothetical protein